MCVGRAAAVSYTSGPDVVFFLIGDVVGNVVCNVVGKLAPQISCKFAVNGWPVFAHYISTTSAAAGSNNTPTYMQRKKILTKWSHFLNYLIKCYKLQNTLHKCYIYFL